MRNWIRNIFRSTPVSLDEFSDEELFYASKKREFKDINVGDDVLAYGTDGPEIMEVVTKTEYACNLMTKNKNASYYRTYAEIIGKVYHTRITGDVERFFPKEQ